MITSAIGRIFLNAYNEENHTAYNVETFFEEVYFPIIFGGGKYALWVQNSPFVQGLKGVSPTEYGKEVKGKDGHKTIKLLDEEMRSEMLQEYKEKIEQGYTDASVAIGYPASDKKEFQSTSGQVTDMCIPILKEDILLSWIGNALAICVQGGNLILFNQKKILLDIFRGWKYYRSSLNNNIKLKGNQINTWNGQWLVHYYDHRFFDERNPMANFSPYLSSKDGILSVGLQTWTKVLIGISRRYKYTQVMGYVYNIGQTNTTIGFIPFNLEQIRRPIQLYEKFFGMDDGRQAEYLWGTAMGFKTACKTGAIGLKAMEPKGMLEYMQKGKLPKPEKDEEQRITYNTYKIWILAMLNNDKLWAESQELAQLLMDVSVDKDKKISTKRSNTIEGVLSTVNKKQFVEAVTNLMPALESSEKLVAIVKDVHSMPNDNVPYFLTLVRFQYAALNKSNH